MCYQQISLWNLVSGAPASRPGRKRLSLTTAGAPRPCGRRHAEPCQSSLLRLQVTPARCGEWAEIPVAASGRLASLLEKNGGKLGITSKTDVTQDVVSIKTRHITGVMTELVKATLASCCKQRALSDFSKYIVQSDNTLSAVVLQHNCTSVVKCLQRRAVIHRGL